MKLFSLDSPIGRAIALIADLVVLNMLFLFSCIPVVTIGAACGGLYSTVHAMLTGSCGAVSRTYFAGFKACFKRGTVLFLVSAAAAGVVVFDGLCAMQLQGVIGIVCLGVILASGLLVLAVMALLPMVLCRNPGGKVGELIKDSFLMSMKSAWRTIAAVVLNGLPFVLFFFFPMLFLQTWMFWLLLGSGAVAYVNNWLLLRHLDPETWTQLRPVSRG